MFNNLRNKLAVLALVAFGLAFGQASGMKPAEPTKTNGDLIYDAIMKGQRPDEKSVGWKIETKGAQEKKEQKKEMPLESTPSWRIIALLNDKNVGLIKTKIIAMIQQQDVIDHIIVHNIASSHIIFKDYTDENSPELIVVSKPKKCDGYFFSNAALDVLHKAVGNIIAKSCNIEAVINNKALKSVCSELKEDIRNFLNGNPLSIKGCAFFRDQTFIPDRVDDGLKYLLKHYAAGQLFAQLQKDAQESLRKRLKEQICNFLSNYKITVNTDDDGDLSLSSPSKNGMLKLILSIADDNSIYISHFGLSSSKR